MTTAEQLCSSSLMTGHMWTQQIVRGAHSTSRLNRHECVNECVPKVEKYSVRWGRGYSFWVCFQISDTKTHLVCHKINRTAVKSWRSQHNHQGKAALTNLNRGYQPDNRLNLTMIPNRGQYKPFLTIYCHFCTLTSHSCEVQDILFLTSVIVNADVAYFGVCGRVQDCVWKNLRTQSSLVKSSVVVGWCSKKSNAEESILR